MFIAFPISVETNDSMLDTSIWQDPGLMHNTGQISSRCGSWANLELVRKAIHQSFCKN